MAKLDRNVPASLSLIHDYAKKCDEHFTLETDEFLNRKEAVQIGALPTAFELLRMFGDDGIAALPIVGSTKDSGKNNWDVYETTETKDDGSTVTREHSVIADLAYASPNGVAIDTEITRINAALAKKEDAPDKYKTLSDVEQKSKKARLTQRRSNLRALWQRSIRIIQQMVRFSEMNTLDVRVFTTPVKPDSGLIYLVPGEQSYNGKPEYLVNVPKPFILGEVDPDTNRVTEKTSVSISTFLSYDVQKAIDNGGKFSDLLATAGRKPKDGAPTTLKPITGESKAGEYWAELEAYYCDPKDGNNRVAKLMATKNDAAFLSACRVAGAVNGFITKGGPIEARYQRLEVASVEQAA